MGLRHRVAELSMDVSFESSGAKLASMTARGIGKRQLEKLVVRAAQDFEAFYDARQEATVDQEQVLASNKLLILSTDGKGIVMRHDSLRPATAKKVANSRKKLQTCLSPGEKRNRKRMAEVATVYEIEVRPRSPDDVMPEPSSGDESEDRVPRPRPENKRVWASVTDSSELCARQATSTTTGTSIAAESCSGTTSPTTPRASCSTSDERREGPSHQRSRTQKDSLRSPLARRGAAFRDMRGKRARRQPSHVSRHSISADLWVPGRRPSWAARFDGLQGPPGPGRLETSILLGTNSRELRRGPWWPRSVLALHVNGVAAAQLSCSHT
jgi:hypothetical protein